MNPQRFLSGYDFHASGEFGSESGYFLFRSPEWKKGKSTTNPITCGRRILIFSNPMTAINKHLIFFLTKSCPVSYRTINQYGGTASRPCFSRVNLDTMGCVWSGEFDLNTLRVDGEKETVADSKISRHVWTVP